VPRIEWVAIQSNVRPEAAVFFVTLGSIVARPAQALKLAEPERIPIASMRNAVIGDRCRHHETPFLAEPAERFD
jgi:hypothetical protein